MDLFIFWIIKMCQLENSKHHDKLLWEECKQFLWRSKLHHSWKWVCCRLSLSDSTLRLEFLTFVHKWSGLFCIPNILNMIYCPTAHMGPSMYYVIKNWGFLTWRLPDNYYLTIGWRLPENCLTTASQQCKTWQNDGLIRLSHCKYIQFLIVSHFPLQSHCTVYI